MRKTVSVAILILILGGLLVYAANRKEPVTKEKVPIIQDVPKDAIVPLDFPSYVSSKEANWLKDDDIVLGVSFEEDARAYPALILNWHEIVNEKIAGRDVVITYCPLCRSGIVFDRQLDGRVLTFGNTGALYESDLVMYDRETQSYWYQVGGRSIKGPLEGRKLTILPSLLTTWQEWRRIHPDTKVLSKNTGYRRDYQSDHYLGYDSPNSPPAFPVSKTDSRLPPKTKVVGVLINDSPKAYPLQAIAGKTIQDTVGGQKIEVAGSENAISARVFSLDGGLRRELPAVATFWFAWFAAHPDTQIYSATEPETIHIPVVLHLVKDSGTVSTARNQDNASSLFKKSQSIWDQANITFDVSVTETKLNANLQEAVRQGKFRGLQAVLTGNDRAFHVFFVRSLLGANGLAQPPKIALVADQTSVNDFRATAHEIGHLLGLSHTDISPERLLFRGANGTKLSDEEISIARDTAKNLAVGKS